MNLSVNRSKESPFSFRDIGLGGTLVHLGVDHIDAKTATDTVNILLKYRSDIEKTVKEFATDESLNIDQSSDG